MFELIGMIAAGLAGLVGYRQARSFVRSRLRYVDAVHTARAPFIAGIAAAVLAAPVVLLLPIVGSGTALVFGLSVGLGVSAGAREVRGLLRA